MNGTAGFEVVTADGGTPGNRVVAGFAGPDLAALTAVDFLIDATDNTLTASVRTEGLPDVAAVTDGEPRHPIRVYTIEALDLSVMTGEAFIPVVLADQFADALATWLNDADISTFTLLHGGQFPHGSEEHIPFLVASGSYRDRLNGEPIESLPSGMLDGIAGEVLLRGIEETLPPTGVIVTPAHLPGPDINAAIGLLGGLSKIYGFALDDAALRERAERLRRYYEGLVDRMQAIRDADSSATSRDFPEDRMYM